MKIFNSEEFINMENPTPSTTFIKELLGAQDAQRLIGVFGLVVPGSKGGNYHYHEKGEHIITIISGEGTEIIEGEEFPVKAGDVLFIPAGEKHTIMNNSDRDLRYFGFCTCTVPGKRDMVEVK